MAEIKKIVLSIHYGHNAAVALSVNGEIVCIVCEERISRIKNSTGFPFACLTHITRNYLDNDINKVNLIVLNDEKRFGIEYLSKNGYTPHKYIDYFYRTRKDDIFGINKKRPFYFKVKEKLSYMYHTLRKNNKKADAYFSEFISKTGLDQEKVKFLNHHLAHAYSTLYFYNEQPKKIIFTLDGEGDGLCASVNIWDGKNMERISSTDRSHSLGYLYSDVTAYMGMKSNEHEFKVMGLAPYADEKQVDRVKEIFEEILWIDDDGNFNSKFSLMSFDLTEYLIQNLIYERFDNIAGALQKFSEEIICRWVSFWINKTSIHNIGVAGGVFMNVKAIKKVGELQEVSSIHVVPSSGDESLVIGGCYWGNIQLNASPNKKIKDLYLGRDFSDDEIGSYLETISNKYQYIKLDTAEMAKRAAWLLANNEIIARFYGREEWGARALGNRSILCNPGNFKNINILNKKIKMRDFWMPFTPSILAEDIGQYIINSKKINNDFMCITFDTTLKAQEEIIAAIHPNDFTARPQAVSKDSNPAYYEILKEFKKLTNISGIINTSFNLHGEPNVGSPSDAIHTLENSGLKYLILGNYFVEKV